MNKLINKIEINDEFQSTSGHVERAFKEKFQWRGKLIFNGQVNHINKNIKQFIFKDTIDENENQKLG